MLFYRKRILLFFIHSRHFKVVSLYFVFLAVIYS